MADLTGNKDNKNVNTDRSDCIVIYTRKTRKGDDKQVQNDLHNHAVGPLAYVLQVFVPGPHLEYLAPHNLGVRVGASGCCGFGHRDNTNRKIHSATVTDQMFTVPVTMSLCPNPVTLITSPNPAVASIHCFPVVHQNKPYPTYIIH